MSNYFKSSSNQTFKRGIQTFKDFNRIITSKNIFSGILAEKLSNYGCSKCGIMFLDQSMADQCLGQPHTEPNGSCDLNNQTYPTAEELINNPVDVYAWTSGQCIYTSGVISELTNKEDQNSLLTALQIEKEQLIIINNKYMACLKKCDKDDIYEARELTIGNKKYMVTFM